MIQITDQINRKKQETARMEKENRDLSQKYEEITSKIKEKELEVCEIQKQVSEAYLKPFLPQITNLLGSATG